MRYFIPFILFVCLHAQEFPFIEPISVEDAPLNVKTKAKIEKKVFKQKKIKIKKQPTKIKQKIKNIDSDGDGIIDKKDKCPNTGKNLIVDYNGCPKTASLNINFDLSKYNILKHYTKNLKTFSKFLKQNKGCQVVIYGYADSTGSKKGNKILSQKRANEVKKTLQKYGVNSTKLTAIGMGDENPIADNADADGRAKNRRIEIELIF
jgi:OOP family OmpA-OmpF porin